MIYILDHIRMSPIKLAASKHPKIYRTVTAHIGNNLVLSMWHFLVMFVF